MSPLLALIALSATQNTAVVPMPVEGDWWQLRHAAIVDQAQHGDAKLVFVGDSITHAFGGLPDTQESFHNRGEDTWNYFYGEDHPVNLGISGDKTQNVLWRLDHGELGKCKPKVAVVMIGTNNLGSNSAEEIAEGTESVCTKVNGLSPSTKVLLLGIFPRDKADSKFRQDIDLINRQLASWAPGHGVRYLDISSVFLDSNQEISPAIMPDFLHPSTFGYRKWAMAMEPTLASLLGRKPKTRLDPNNSAVVPVTQSRDSSYNWWERFKATKVYADEHPCRFAVIGDSIVHRFAGPPLDRGLTEPGKVWQQFYGNRFAVDLGFGWDRTENVLWRLEQGELDKMPLKSIMLMIGTNNIEFNTPEEIRDGVRAIVDTLRKQKPRAKILLLAIFPRGEHPTEPDRLKVAQVNKLIEPLGKQKNVTYMDIGAKFVEPDGTITRDTMFDFLHPTDKGYQIWAEAVEPWVKANTPVHDNGSELVGFFERSESQLMKRIRGGSDFRVSIPRSA
jgi:lysophospholipase L1-like esterase